MSAEFPADIPEQYIPSGERYEDALRRYREFVSQVSSRGEGVRKLAEFLETQTSWLWAPASTQFHLNIPGGLVIHSVSVTETLLKLRDTLAPQYSDETCIIVGLFHDIGKVGEPGKPLYIPDPEAPPEEIRYIHNPEVTTMAHAVRSLYYITQFIPLTFEEVQAVVYHDGQYVEGNKIVALKETPLLLLLHFADLWSASMLE